MENDLVSTIMRHHQVEVAFDSVLLLLVFVTGILGATLAVYLVRRRDPAPVLAATVVATVLTAGLAWVANDVRARHYQVVDTMLAQESQRQPVPEDRETVEADCETPFNVPPEGEGDHRSPSRRSVHALRAP